MVCVTTVAIFLIFSVHFREKGLKSPMFAYISEILEVLVHFRNIFLLLFSINCKINLGHMTHKVKCKTLFLSYTKNTMKV